MQKFVGTKIVNAAPLSRGEYNDLRGLELPEDENGADEGYQVRMVAELTELEAKVQKLGAYITSDKFGELDPRKADLLRRQMDYMNMYASILTQRVGLEQSEE